MQRFTTCWDFFDKWIKMMEEKAANMPVMAIDESPEKLGMP